MGRPRKNLDWLDTMAGEALREQVIHERDAFQQKHAFVPADAWLGDGDRLIDERELAGRLVLSPSVLSHWRSRGEGPPYFKFGPAHGAPVRYAWNDVMDWIRQRYLIVPGSDQPDN